MEVGRIIGGKYRLRYELGEGAMGSVWAGVHELLGRSVAIKFMRPALEDAETAAARFVAEAKAAAQLKHRFIVDVFDFGITEDGLSYMVQELLDGESLAQTMEQGPAWPVTEVVRFAAQCLSGLAAVHESGVVHRDLKPENIFVMRDADGRFPKLLDFGISKAASAIAERATGRVSTRPSLRTVRTGRTRQLTALGAALGTPAYMAPEQLLNQSDLDARADLYSLGVVLYEWLSGHCPYAPTGDFAALERQIRARDMTPIERLRPDLSPALCQVVTRALAPEASDRFFSASEMREALLQTLDGLGSAFSVVQSSSQRPPRMGAKTQVLLESARDPFADPDQARFLPRFPTAFSALVATLLLGLSLALWLPSRKQGSAVPQEALGSRAAEPPSAGPNATPAQKVKPPPPSLGAPLPERDLPLGVELPRDDLPMGVDMPSEDLPAEIPERVSAHDTKGRPRGTARRARESAEHMRTAMHPTGSEAEESSPQQSAVSSSSPSPDRPIRQKVVRELDF